MVLLCDYVHEIYSQIPILKKKHFKSGWPNYHSKEQSQMKCKAEINRDYHSRIHWRWNSCLHVVTYGNRWNWLYHSYRSRWKNTQTIYRWRITVAEGLKANAASIITGILNSTFHKGSCRCQMGLRLHGILANFCPSVLQTPPESGLKVLETMYKKYNPK